MHHKNTPFQQFSPPSDLKQFVIRNGLRNRDHDPSLAKSSWSTTIYLPIFRSKTLTNINTLPLLHFKYMWPRNQLLLIFCSLHTFFICCNWFHPCLFLVFTPPVMIQKPLLLELVTTSLGFLLQHFIYLILPLSKVQDCLLNLLHKAVSFRSKVAKVRDQSRVFWSGRRSNRRTRAAFSSTWLAGTRDWWWFWAKEFHQLWTHWRDYDCH